MGIMLSKPITRTVKNSEKNYGKEITYSAITTVAVNGDDSKAVAAIKSTLADVADRIESAFGKQFVCDVLRSDSAVERLFALSEQSVLAVKAAGFTPVVAEAPAKEVSDI